MMPGTQEALPTGGAGCPIRRGCQWLSRMLHSFLCPESSLQFWSAPLAPSPSLLSAPCPPPHPHLCRLPASGAEAVGRTDAHLRSCLCLFLARHRRPSETDVLLIGSEHRLDGANLLKWTLATIAPKTALDTYTSLALGGPSRRLRM